MRYLLYVSLSVAILAGVYAVHNYQSYAVSDGPTSEESDSPIDSTMTDTVNLTAIEFRSYKDNNFGFEIIYPSDWNVTTKNLKKSLVMFTSPDEKVRVLLGTLHRVNDETLKEFGDRYFKNRENILINEYYRNPNTTLAGFPSVKMVGSIDYPATLFEGPHTNFVMYNNCVLENRDVILEALYASREYSAFNEFRTLGEKMIASIKLVDKQPIIQEQD